MASPITAALLASCTHFTTVGSAFIRNIIFARLLSPDDFGIAMTFGLVLLLLEYTSNFGHENLLVSSRHGNSHGFQATVHSTLIMRGILVSAIIIVAAPYISQFFKLPLTTFNYALLAIIPFIRGFTHMDCVRFQRDHNFLPGAKVIFIADGLSIIVALICAYTMESYWSFYISFVFRHSVSTLLTHIMASRRYSLRLHKKYLLQLLSFGAPLIIVGITKYLGGETDKALVARHSGLEIFTSYLLTIMLISNGTNLVSIAFSKIFIRRISINRDIEQQRIAYRSNGIITLYLLLPILLLMCVFAEAVITIIFGKAYHPVQFLIPIICALTLIRSLNQWLNQIVIASTNTRILVFADIAKLSGLGLAILIASYSTDVRLFSAAFCIGELIYFAVLSIYIHKKHQHFAKVAGTIICGAIIGMLAISGLYEVLETKSFIIKIIATKIALIALIITLCKMSTTCLTTTQRVWQYLGVEVSTRSDTSH